MKQIVFAKPKLGASERLRVSRVLRSGMLAQGIEVSKFESDFANTHNVDFASAVNSGTSGLHLALLALGLKDGDEVVVPGISFAATANAVVMAGGVPVFADVDSQTFNLSPEDFRKKITAKTKAVVPVHLYGAMADMESIVEIANSNGISVIEDAAQAHGSSLGGKFAGSFSDAAVFSMYATKNITTGEGGVVLTNNMDLKNLIDELRNQGMTDTYVYSRAGLNNRMTDIQAAIGIEQLKKMARYNSTRERFAGLYEDGLHDSVIRQQHLIDSRSSYHQFTVLIPDKRDYVKNKLSEKGIPSRIFYPQPLNHLKHFRNEIDLPNSQNFVRQCLSLPIGPHLKAYQVKRVIREVNEALGELT